MRRTQIQTMRENKKAVYRDIRYVLRGALSGQRDMFRQVERMDEDKRM